jgi:hypothetical protein
VLLVPFSGTLIQTSPEARERAVVEYVAYVRRAGVAGSITTCALPHGMKVCSCVDSQMAVVHNDHSLSRQPISVDRINCEAERVNLF